MAINEHRTSVAPPAAAPVSSTAMTPAQRRAFWGSFGGWAMDGFNWTIFGLVLAPTMAELLPRAGIADTPDNVGWYGQISAALFLVGWGCSFIWGPLADRFGRKPAMMASILMYGVFTALAGVSTDLWEWNAFRFLAAIGVGGEWAMAGTLLAEVMPEERRDRRGGLMHTAAYVGVLVVSLIYLAFGSALGWRGLFFIGGLPALAVFLIRRGTPEAERWSQDAGERSRRSFWKPLAEVFSAEYRGRTIVNLALLVVCVIGLWAGSTYVATAVTNLAKDAGYAHGTVVHLASLASMTVAAFTILGCVGVPWLAARMGRRGALAVLFALMIVGTVGAYGLAYPMHSIGLTFAFLPLLGLGGANFAVFTIWLPEQYPTRMRATAFAATTTFSRWVAAGGTFLIGYGIHASGSLALPLSLTAVFFVAGLAVVRYGRETTGQTLPD
ncbi:MFS transporter [Streptomyces montanisoli]|uniref:MFS transporter n=1 Tax=Streptomyces montanisoli TaxID=2798581 RepID=A0A940MD59_9ACTN|nr:MFS transporter [Streptomyces montanisoli]MBP0458728.1 MFS transporter [Streptomyces montanisoli]